MNKMMLATLLVLILQPFPVLAQSSHLLSIVEYLPCQPGNCWIFKNRLDENVFGGFYVLDQFTNDSLAFIFVYGLANYHYPEHPDPCATWMTIQLAPPDTVYRGPFTEYDPDQINRAFNRTGIFLVLSDTSRIISADSTIVSSLGIFNHCVVLKPWGAFAPGFGPVSEDLVYAKVNGVEYGTMPKPEATPKSYTVYDYFPPTPGNIWITQISFDRGENNFYALEVLQQFKYDSTAYVVASGLSYKSEFSDSLVYGMNWFTLQLVAPSYIYTGSLRDPDQLYDGPVVRASTWLDLSDSTKFISLDSTIIRPAGTFHNCIVERDGGVWAPGFGPVYPNLVYAKVNGIEYGKMPTASAVESDRPQNVPRGNALYPAYPNPFNQSTGISFNLNKPGPARLTIYDIQGRVVRVLLDEQAAAGSHYLTWDGMTDDSLPCPSGVYFVFLKSAEYSQKRALTLVR